MTWEEAKQAALQAQREGDLGLAETRWTTAVKAAREFQAPDPRLCQSLEALANCLQNRSRIREAINALQESLELKKRALGPVHPAVATVLNQLARLYYQNQDYAKAREVGETCIQCSERAYGANSPEVATISLNVAYIYHRDKKFDKAEPHYKRAMVLRTKQLGGEHRDTIVVLRDYAKLLREMHRDAEADHLDACVKGTITGSWKALTIEPSNKLQSVTCSFCGEAVADQQKCVSCGTVVGSLV